MQVGSGAGMNSEINVTPLIDVVLVLLIIFMVITPIVQLGYDVRIPPKSTVQLPPQMLADQIVLRYTKDKRIFINKEEVPADTFPFKLRELMTGHSDKLVFFSGDRNVNYQDAVRFMDLVRANGVKNLGIVVDQITQ